MKKNIVQHVDLNKENSFIQVDSFGQRKPRPISIKALEDSFNFNYDINKHIDSHTIILDPKTLKIKVNEDILNNFNHSFIDQDISVNTPPEKYPITSGLHITVDENFLYVWIPDASRWKRIPLSEFP